MVRLTQTQRRDTIAVHYCAERIVAECVGVPLREHDDCFPARISSSIARGKPARVYSVVFWIRRPHWRGKSQELHRLQFTSFSLSVPPRPTLAILLVGIQRARSPL